MLIIHPVSIVQLYFCCLRSRGRDWTLRASLHPLRTALQRTCHPAPSQHYRNCLSLSLCLIIMTCPSYTLPTHSSCRHRQAQQIRNIAEELDPTFQGRRQGIESLRVGQTGIVVLRHYTQTVNQKLDTSSLTASPPCRPSPPVTPTPEFWRT